MAANVPAVARKRGKGRPWRPGESGNPKGRVVGSRHKATIAAESLLDGEVEKLTRRAIEAALGGDMVAMRLCLDRIVPPRRDRPITITVPTITNAADVLAASSAILASVAAGEITPAEGAELSKLLDGH